MPLTCNIDNRGKWIRIINGLVTLAVCLVVLFKWALPTHSVWAWVAVVATLIAGGFMIFEGLSKWCVVRAMGFKTKF